MKPKSEKINLKNNKMLENWPKYMTVGSAGEAVLVIGLLWTHFTVWLLGFFANALEAD